MVGTRSGAMASVEVLTGNIEFFTLFTTLDITASGNFADNSQKDFESVVQVIGMRAMPTVMNNPVQLNGVGNNLLENYGDYLNLVEIYKLKGQRIFLDKILNILASEKYKYVNFKRINEF